jgi:amidophosphoribosyltransferase
MCGVFGIHAPGRDVARLTYFGLYALQHRGQESAGIAVSDGRRVTAVKEMGLVAQVFDESNLRALSGVAAIGHTRYSTTGSTQWHNSQPVVQHRLGRTVALGHNGNLTNTRELREELVERGIRLTSTSDTEVICALIAHHQGSLYDAAASAMARLRGAFSAVVLSDDAMLAFRDPDGIRPLVLGRLEDGGTVVASETPALDIVGAELVRELEPGELVVCDAGGQRVEQAVPARRRREALCIFEHIYFARPDAQMDGQALHAVRVRMGRLLADEAPIDADVVIPIPDSGTPAALGYSQRSLIPFADGLIKNRYVGRTFIQPEQGDRDQGLRLKFNPLPHVLAGKRVVVVDDSIVRGSTTRKIVALLRDAGAREVHLRVSSPPIVSPCFYGIDMAAEDELIAARRSVEEVREVVGADSLAYLSLEGLQEATERPAAQFCRACLTREYPVPVPAELSADKLAFEPVARRRRQRERAVP